MTRSDRLVLGVCLLCAMVAPAGAQQPAEPPRPPAAASVLEELAFTRQELFRVRSELRKLAVEEKVLQARAKLAEAAPLAAPADEPTAIEEAVARTPEVQQRLATVAKAEERLASFQRVTLEGKELKRAQDEANSARAELAAAVAEVRGRLLKQRELRNHRTVEVELVPLQARAQALKEQEADLAAEVKRLEQLADRADASNEAVARRIGRLEDEIKGLKATLEEVKALLKKSPKDP